MLSFSNFLLQKCYFLPEKFIMEKLENNRVLIVDTFPISNYDSQLSAYSFLVQSSHHHNIYISNNFSDQINLYFLYRHVSWIAPIIRRNKLILIYIYLYIVHSTMQSKGCFHETDLLDARSCGGDEKRPLTAGVGSCKAISQAGAQVMR